MEDSLKFGKPALVPPELSSLLKTKERKFIFIGVLKHHIKENNNNKLI